MKFILPCVVLACLRPREARDPEDPQTHSFERDAGADAHNSHEGRRQRRITVQASSKSDRVIAFIKKPLRILCKHRDASKSSVGQIGSRAPHIIGIQAEARGNQMMSESDSASQQRQFDPLRRPAAARSAAAAAAEASSHSLPTTGLHSRQTWVNIDIAKAPSTARIAAAAAASNSTSSFAQLPADIDLHTHEEPCRLDLLALLTAAVYLFTLLVAIILYTILGDAGFLKVPEVLRLFVVSSALHFQKRFGMAKTKLISQVRSWLALVTLTALCHLVSDAIAAVSNVYLRCQSYFTQLKQDYPSCLCTAWTSVTAAGASMNSYGGRAIRHIKDAVFKSTRALLQLAANAEQMCPGTFTCVFSLMTAVILLMLIDSYPVQMLQALLSACVIAIVLAALCELSGSRGMFLLPTIATVLGISMQTAKQAVSTASTARLPAALRGMLSSSATADCKVSRCSDTLSCFVSAYKAVIAISWSSAQTHAKPGKGQQTRSDGAPSPTEDAVGAADKLAPAPASDVGKHPAVAVQASEPPPVASQATPAKQSSVAKPVASRQTAHPPSAAGLLHAAPPRTTHTISADTAEASTASSPPTIAVPLTTSGAAQLSQAAAGAQVSIRAPSARTGVTNQAVSQAISALLGQADLKATKGDQISSISVQSPENATASERPTRARKQAGSGARLTTRERLARSQKKAGNDAKGPVSVLPMALVPSTSAAQVASVATKPNYMKAFPASFFEPTPFSPAWKWLKDRSLRLVSAAGGTAKVYWAEKAMQQQPGMVASHQAVTAKHLRVAVKQIANAHLPQTAALVKQEADLLSKFAGKPFMVDFHGLYCSSADTAAASVQLPGAQQNCAYIVMGLVQGKSLQSVCGDVFSAVQGLSAEKLAEVKGWVCHLAIHVLHALAQALADVHKTTAHRDIKPDNVLLMLDDSGKLQVKLIDWGSSRSIAAECKNSANYTAQYAPPEVIALYGTDKALPPAGPHDMWSLGVIFQQILAASCQIGPLFLRDAVAVAAVCDPHEQRGALHAAVAAEQQAWEQVHTGMPSLDPQGGPPAQLQSLPTCLDGTVCMAEVSSMLAKLCHPSCEARITAAEVASTTWISQAAQKPLAKCPVADVF